MHYLSQINFSQFISYKSNPERSIIIFPQSESYGHAPIVIPNIIHAYRNPCVTYTILISVVTLYEIVL